MSEDFHFRISTGLKSVIGKELITDDRIAIFELVKNSFDARASRVDIIFRNVKEHSADSCIIIKDDGGGMGREDIIDKFMFVGYSEKRKGVAGESVDYRDKIKEGRFFAGAKGVGRFSCDKLGKSLKLFTKKSTEDFIHRVDVNWGDFEQDQKTEFQIVNATYHAVDSLMEISGDLGEFNKGTIFVIQNLNDAWDQDKLVLLRRHLQRLINPAQLDQKDTFRIFINAEEFKDEDAEARRKQEDWRVVNGEIKNLLFEELNIKTTLISSEIDAEGKTITTKLVDQGTEIFELVEANTYACLKGIHALVFYLNQSAKTTFTRLMGIRAQEYGSIFLYRNGIRIQPYGDPEDDWLKLDQKKGQGQRRQLGTREVIGRIEISGEQPQFIEVSSRDGGIVRNECYLDLTVFFAEKLMKRLTRYVVEGLNWERAPKEEAAENSLQVIYRLVDQEKKNVQKLEFNENLLGILKEKEVQKLPELIRNVQFLGEFVKKPSQKKYLDEQLKALGRVTRRLKTEEKEAKKKAREAQKTSLFLTKAISTDQEVVTNLNHTITISTLQIHECIIDINKLIKGKKPISEIAPLLDRISIENEKIRTLAGFVSQANFNTKVARINKDIVQYIKQYLEIIRSKRMQFRFVNETISFQMWFRPIEVSIMMDNFISNAKKAGASIMIIEFDKTGRSLSLRISDNGQGVDKKDERFLFNRGHTTTSGAGIGLHHIREIARGMGGEAQFIGNNVAGHARGACFEVQLK